VPVFFIFFGVRRILVKDGICVFTFRPVAGCERENDCGKQAAEQIT
jgi:hypothetical protein